MSTKTKTGQTGGPPLSTQHTHTHTLKCNMSLRRLVLCAHPHVFHLLLVTSCSLWFAQQMLADVCTEPRQGRLMDATRSTCVSWKPLCSCSCPRCVLVLVGQCLQMVFCLLPRFLTRPHQNASTQQIKNSLQRLGSRCDVHRSHPTTSSV